MSTHKFDKSLDKTIAEAALSVRRNDGSIAYELVIRAASYDGGPIKFYLVKCSGRGQWESYTLGRQSPATMRAFFRQIDVLDEYLRLYAPDNVRAEYLACLSLDVQ